MMFSFPEYNWDVSKIDFMINKIINLDRYDYPETDSNGSKIWKNKEGQVHRTDGPAIIYADGTQVYYIEGQWHRTDGPAVIYPDGTEFYLQNGKRHRTDGPAVIESDGHEEYWKNGIQIK